MTLNDILFSSVQKFTHFKLFHERTGGGGDTRMSQSPEAMVCGLYEEVVQTLSRRKKTMGGQMWLLLSNERKNNMIHRLSFIWRIERKE